MDTQNANTRLRDDDDGVLTPERRSIANGALIREDIFDPKSASRVPIGTAYRIATPIYKLHLDGRLSFGEIKAGDLFYRDYTLGVCSPRMSGRYGTDFAMAGLGSGGTPLAQLNDDHEEEFHIFHAKRYARACQHVAHKPTSYWMTAMICEVHVGEPARIPTFEDIGRGYAGYDNRQRAMAAGVTLIKSGLERLTVFYGTESGGP